MSETSRVQLEQVEVSVDPGVSKVRAPGLISVAGGRGGEAIYRHSQKKKKKKKAHQEGDVISRVYIDSVGRTCARVA